MSLGRSHLHSESNISISTGSLPRRITLACSSKVCSSTMSSYNFHRIPLSDSISLVSGRDDDDDVSCTPAVSININDLVWSQAHLYVSRSSHPLYILAQCSRLRNDGLCLDFSSVGALSASSSCRLRPKASSTRITTNGSLIGSTLIFAYVWMFSITVSGQYKLDQPYLRLRPSVLSVQGSGGQEAVRRSWSLCTVSIFDGFLEYMLMSSSSSYVNDEMTGDTMNAEERLRCFFEQYFHERSDSYVHIHHYWYRCQLGSFCSGMRQLALLNLARMHYIHREFPACQKVLTTSCSAWNYDPICSSQLLHEAINVARSHNDRLTLQHCLGYV